jgi:hypothetical protein
MLAARSAPLISKAVESTATARRMKGRKERK